LREWLRLSVFLMAVALALAACSKAQTSSNAPSQSEVCTRCHGDPARSNTAVNPQLSAAPPVDIYQQSATSSPGVGAHQAHLNDGALRDAIPCTECHSVPADLSNHPTGQLNLTWGPIAAAQGATPTFANGTCASTYCHGATLKAGGTNQMPSWTGGASEASCGTCHAIPPPATSHHPQNSNCGACHPGYTSTSVNPALHVNGQVDLNAGGCSACHGDPNRQATAVNPQLAAAPPVDTNGDSSPSAPGVGAHQAHLNDGPFRTAIACDECHTVPTSLANHPTGTLNLTWGPLASTSGASPVFSNGGSSQAACGTCHGLPPPASTGHPQNTNCGGCHTGYTSSSVNLATHINGTIDVGALSCTSCHGDATRQATALNPQLPAAPPVDTSGNSDPSSPGVGAHQAHLNAGSLRGALACTECHTVPTSLASHPNGTLNLTWGALATTGGASPSFANGTCSSTYCHGATLNAGGTNQTPNWTGGSSQAACGTCHGLPPPASSGHPQLTNCGGCHPGYTSSSVNAATHIDGQIEVQLTCTSCHGDATRVATALNPQLPAAPPSDTLGNTATTFAGVGAHQSHLNDGPMRGALACTECHQVPTSTSNHPTGTLNLTWGPLATSDGVKPSFSGSTCTNYCHGATLLGGAITAPTWTTVNGSQDACGTCHGLPPLALPSTTHPTYVLSAPCAGCHPTTATVDSSGANVIVAGGTHINGTVEDTFGGHPAGWVDPTLTVQCSNMVQVGGGHTCFGDMTDYMPGQCTNCHGNGSDFTQDGGSSHVSCAACHVNAFASTTCGPPFNVPSPCSCDLCHSGVDVIIP